MLAKAEGTLSIHQTLTPWLPRQCAYGERQERGVPVVYGLATRKLSSLGMF